MRIGFLGRMCSDQEGQGRVRNTHTGNAYKVFDWKKIKKEKNVKNERILRL